MTSQRYATIRQNNPDYLVQSILEDPLESDFSYLRLEPVEQPDSYLNLTTISFLKTSGARGCTLALVSTDGTAFFFFLFFSTTFVTIHHNAVDLSALFPHQTVQGRREGGGGMFSHVNFGSVWKIDGEDAVAHAHSRV